MRPIYFNARTFSFLLYLSLFLYQAAQLTHVLDRRLKELFEDAEQEKALKEVVEVTIKDKAMAAEIAKKKVATFKKAKVLAEERFLELEVKVGETELKLAKAESFNITQAEELADLKVALEACENKWYNEGFADAKNSKEPVVREAWKLWFEEGWLATL